MYMYKCYVLNCIDIYIYMIYLYYIIDSISRMVKSTIFHFFELAQNM